MSCTKRNFFSSSLQQNKHPSILHLTQNISSHLMPFDRRSRSRSFFRDRDRDRRSPFRQKIAYQSCLENKMCQFSRTTPIQVKFCPSYDLEYQSTKILEIHIISVTFKPFLATLLVHVLFVSFFTLPSFLRIDEKKNNGKNHHMETNSMYFTF